MFSLLHALLHGTVTLVSLFNSDANAAPVSVQALCSVTTVQALMLAMMALKQPGIEC